jgi:RNA polymerase sigma-70 factor (ECF subfamily)
MQPPSDEQQRVMSVQGSPDDFNEIVRRYAPPLLRFVRAGVGNIQDAEDIVQETFLRAYTRRHQFDPRRSLKCWLFTIAHRCRISFLRRRRTPAAEPAAEPSTAPSPLAALIQRQERGLLWDHARRLPNNQFTVLWLRYQEGMEVSQVARVMGLSRVHVRVLLHRARQTLARDLPQGAKTGETRMLAETMNAVGEGEIES